MFMTNNPYITGRHQLDVVVVAPIFRDEQLVAWSGTIVHQNDVGGPVRRRLRGWCPIDLRGGDPDGTA